MEFSAELAKEMKYGVDQRPPVRAAIFLVLQALAKTSDALIIPLLVGQLAGLKGAEIGVLMSGTLLMTAITTLLLSNRKTGCGYFAPATTSTAFHAVDFQAILSGGVGLMSGMILFGAAVRLLLTPLLRPLRHLFTPVLAGFVITGLAIYLGQMGLRLLLVNAEFGDVLLHGALLTAPLEQVNVAPVTVGLVSLLLMVCIAMWSPRTLRPFGVLIGIVFATLLSLVLDRTLAISVEWKEIPWWGVPKLGHWGWAFDWRFVPSYLVSAVLSVIHFYGKLASLEFNNGFGARAYDFRAIRKGNIVVGVMGLVGSLFGAPMHDLRAEGVGLQHATGVYSRWIAYPLSFIFLALAFCPRVAATLGLVPPAAIGATMVFIGVHLAIVGLRMIDFPGLSPAHASAIAIALAVQAVAPALLPLYSFFEKFGIQAGDPTLLWSVVIFFVVLPFFYWGYLLRGRKT